MVKKVLLKGLISVVNVKSLYLSLHKTLYFSPPLKKNFLVDTHFTK